MRFSWRIELPQLAVIAAMFVAATVAWPRAPERVPVHWNIQGQVDRYGGKFEGLLLTPLIALGLYVLLLVLPRFDPGYANYRRFATPYTVIRYLLIVVTTAIYTILLMSMFGHSVNTSAAILSIIGLLFIVLGNLMGKIRPNWFVGVRTPWTLSSKTSWTKTHRLAGWLFILMGVVSLAAGLVGAPWAVVTMIVVCGASVVWMVLYSYLVWRTDPHRVPPAGTTPSDE